MTREPVPPTPRRQMTPKRRQAAVARSGGHCAYPGCEVTTGLEIDHAIALELGGKDDDANLQALCEPHHKSKTKLDAKLIAKSRRLRKRADGTRTPRKAIPTRKLQSRPFGQSRPFPKREGVRP